MSTAIGVQFTVNDLNSEYEVLGTSDNYSFQQKVGRGSELVQAIGETAQVSVDLKGNYGEFTVRVFAVSDIGIRSAFLQSGININAPEYDSTFTFSDLIVSNLPGNPVVGSEVDHFPQLPDPNLLSVSSEFVEKNVEIEWRLTPPPGHAKEGQALGAELLSDSFFSHFEIELRSDFDGTVVSDSELNDTINQGLQSYLNTANVSEAMDNYRGFSFQLSPLTFEELGLQRDISMQIISHDSFGRTATGELFAKNYKPQIEELSHSLFGSKVGFAWKTVDTDYASTNIRSLAIPSDFELKYPSNFQSNLDYYNKISNAIKWSNNVPSWEEGDCARHEGSIYECLEDYVSIQKPSVTPSSPIDNGVTYWAKKEDDFQFITNNYSLTEENVSFDHVWGYKYYYSFIPKDEYGEGDKYNVTADGAVVEGEENSDLYGFVSEVKISNLNFIEREDDLIFRWNITDQDGNLVDLNQYKFILSPNDTPSVLGISGSLFDADSNLFLTGITEGLNSKGSVVDENGDRKVVNDLPGTKVFETFDYTREINNSLYPSEGFPVNAKPFDSTKSYQQGDQVTAGVRLYDAISSVQDFIFPEYQEWDKSKNYVFNSATSLGQNSLVEYNGEIYSTTGSSPKNIGPESSSVDGVFDEGKAGGYSIGDMVVAPVSSHIKSYDNTKTYVIGDVVLHDGYIYRCIRLSNGISPTDSGQKKWIFADLFDEIDCEVYKSTQNSNSEIPATGSGWEVQNPEVSDEYEKIIVSYDLPVYNYSTEQRYFPGSLVIINNDIFSGKLENGLGASAGIRVPDGESDYWTALDGNGVDISTNHTQGDIVYHNGAVYECLSSNPNGAPILNIGGTDNLINSTYQNSQWRPFWEKNTGFQDIPFGHLGIPESGKRKVGISLGIIDPEGNILNSNSLIGFNLEPSILANGFSVDSLEKVTTTKFNFRYANEAREMVNRLQMYRSSDPNFSVTGENGLPGSGSPNFVKEVFGPTEQNFGENINSIIDENPPLPYTHESKTPDSRGDGITGYYYKLLPFDEFGSGDLFTLRDNAGDPERILIYPFHYSNSNPDGFMGPAFGKTTDAIPGAVENFEGDTAFVNYFLDWEIPKSEFLEGSGTLLSLPNDISHYEVWQSEDNYLYFGAENEFLKHDRNISGYRKITGDLTSIADEIPIEELDPASGITNALHVLDASALGPQMSITHRGQVNDKRYFWVRAVDHGGNKGPFTGKAATDDVIEGLELILGQQSPTDISDFEQNITNAFPNTVALVPNNPFKNNTPQADSISWDRHFLYIEGEGYVIGDPTSPKFLDPNGVYDENRVFIPSNSTEQGKTTDAYVYFKPDEAIEINQSELEELGLALPGEKVKLLKGQITNVSTPSFNSFSVDSELVSQPSFSPITTNDPGTYIKFLSNNLAGQEREIDTYDAIDGTITTKRPFVGSPAVGDDFEIIREVPLTSEQNNPLRNIKYTGDYRTSNYHPAGEGETSDPSNYGGGGDIDGEKRNLLDDGDKIIARNSAGIAVPMWHAFANATIGTAHIQKAAITNAKIHNLTADKIRSAEILSQDIQIGGTAESGQIRSAGFGETISHPGGTGYDGFDYQYAGFVISGNGSFMFKGDDTNGPGGKLYYENGQLTIEGNLKQRDGSDLAVVNMYAEPDIFTYDEDGNGDFTPNPPNQTIKIRNHFKNSSLSASDIRYKMEYANGDLVFDYDAHTNGEYNISGFSYDPSDADHFSSSSSTSMAEFVVEGNGFDEILKRHRLGAYSDLSVVVYASGLNTFGESSVTVSTNLQGPVGETGRSPVYRGVWNSNSCYNGLEDKQTLRGDVVYFNNLDTTNRGAPGGDFYIAKKDSGPVGNCGAGFPGAKQPKGDGSAGVVDSEYWKIFGAQFESVATKLLLANDAIITNTLSMGVNDPIENPNNPGGGSGGTIESAGFIGGLDPANGLVRTTENYSTPGFRLRRAKDSSGNSFVITDIGGEKELNFFEFESSSSSNNTYEEGNIISFGGLNYRKKSPGTLVGAVVAPTIDTTNWEAYSDATKISSYIRISNSTGLIEIAGSVFDGSISSDEIKQLEPDPNNPGELIPKRDAFGNILTPGESFLSSIKGNFASFIGGGFNNKFDTEFSPGSRTAEDSFANISCGIVAGASNEIKSKFSFIGAGFNNLCRDNFSSILGGHSNSMPNDIDKNGGSNLIGGGTYNKIDGGSNQLIGGGEHNEINYNNFLPATIPDTVPSLVMPTTAGQEQNIRAVIDPDRMIYSKYVLGNGTDDLAGSNNSKYNSWISSMLYFADTSNFNLYLHGGINPEGFAEWAFVHQFLGSNKSSWMYISPLWTGSNSWETNRALGIAASAWFYVDGGPFGGWIWSQQNLTGSGGDPGHYIYSNTKNSWVYIYTGSTEAYCYNNNTTYSTW